MRFTSKKHALSPVPASINSPVVQQLTFPDAMREILNGKKITRIDWHNADFCLLHGDTLSIYIRGDFHPWLVNDGDMNATDWVVLPDGN